MSEIEDKISQILSNPEALKQVQSLGRQLGLSGAEPKESAPAPPIPSMPSMMPKSDMMSDDMLTAVTRLAPLMQKMKSDDDTTRLLYALRPFLSAEKQKKLDNAEKLMKFIKIIPFLKENGLFF